MSPARSRPGFLRAAHYFGDGWPLDSLMVQRQPYLTRELRALKKLGFNTIILVVPWQGFQVSHEPPAYDVLYESQLRLVLAAANAEGLAVLLRVSYVHQVMLSPTVGSLQMAERLLLHATHETAWLDYLRHVHGIAKEYDCTVGCFIAWEELWHAFRFWQLRDEDQRRELAASVGFLDFLQARNVSGVDAIPLREEPAYRYYHAFINESLRRCFEKARVAAPDLGVEYRVDKDPVYEKDDVQWLDNDFFSDWEPRRYAYWAPFMGADNVGEALSAEQALASLDFMLRSTSEGISSPSQIIEQFNYIDDTAQYAGQHAEIAAKQLPAFLRGAADLLAKHSGGYGLWAPRDYRCNILYNSAFLDSARGWSLKDPSEDGGNSVQEDAKTSTIKSAQKPAQERIQKTTGIGLALESGACATQRIKPGIPWVPRMHPFQEAKLEVQVTPGWSLKPARLRARLNEHTWVDLERTGRGRYAARVPVEFDTIRRRGLHFELENHGARVILERIWLFHLVYRVGVQTERGKASVHTAEIRRFNKRLETLRPSGS